MPFKAKILKDSVNIAGCRLTTFELTYPRFIHSEFMTHRMFSRNSASSRAIPINTMIQNVLDEPVIPIYWGKAQPGMQAGEQIDDTMIAGCIKDWLEARNAAVETARKLALRGLHKQIPNRLLEPWMWITVIASTTSTEHFFRLRCHKAAEPHMQKLAEMMRDVFQVSKPTLLQPGEWHLPLTGFPGDELLCQDALIKCSVGRCARVSYLTHEGKRDPEKDVELYRELEGNGHWSPFEHAAVATNNRLYAGNFQGFVQMRKYYNTEFIPD